MAARSTITPEKVLKAQRLTEKGFTSKEIAEYIKLGVSTISTLTLCNFDLDIYYEYHKNHRSKTNKKSKDKIMQEVEESAKVPSIEPENTEISASELRDGIKQSLELAQADSAALKQITNLLIANNEKLDELITTLHGVTLEKKGFFNR